MVVDHTHNHLSLVARSATATAINANRRIPKLRRLRDAAERIIEPARERCERERVVDHGERGDVVRVRLVQTDRGNTEPERGRFRSARVAADIEYDLRLDVLRLALLAFDAADGRDRADELHRGAVHLDILGWGCRCTAATPTDRLWGHQAVQAVVVVRRGAPRVAPAHPVAAVDARRLTPSVEPWFFDHVTVDRIPWARGSADGACGRAETTGDGDAWRGEPLPRVDVLD